MVWEGVRVKERKTIGFETALTFIRGSHLGNGLFEL